MTDADRVREYEIRDADGNRVWSRRRPRVLWVVLFGPDWRVFERRALARAYARRARALRYPVRVVRYVPEVG